MTMIRLDECAGSARSSLVVKENAIADCRLKVRVLLLYKHVYASVFHKN